MIYRVHFACVAIITCVAILFEALVITSASKAAVSCPHHWTSNKYGEDTRVQMLTDNNKGGIIYNANGTVRAGKWVDEYTGKEYTDARDIQIDHILPHSFIANMLGDCRVKFQQYANDKHNLAIIASDLNRDKSNLVGMQLNKWAYENNIASNVLERIQRDQCGFCKYIAKSEHLTNNPCATVCL